MPLEVLHQISNEPYFMNAMVFYDLLCNSSKCVGPEPTLSACFHPAAKRSIAIFATANVIL